MTTVDAVVRALRRRFAEAGSGSPALDARLIAGHVLDLDAAGLIARGTDPVPQIQLDAIEALAVRRQGGEPIGRILGHREFHGLTFRLGLDTLEPRPDTETLVDVAIGLVRSGGVPGVASDGAGLHFADIGTGTGAIAIAVAVALPRARGLATDISEGALQVARENAGLHGVADRIAFRPGSYLDPLDEPVGLLLSNPPYIATAVIDSLEASVRDHDPRRALDGGPDGLDGYRAIVGRCRAFLSPGGTIAVEIGFDQREAVETLFRQAGLADVTTRPDLAGRDRVVLGRRP